MKYIELLESVLLTEEAVLSSWIEDLTYDHEQGSVIMTLLSGRSYTLYDLDEEFYEEWLAAPSKGIFWHEYVRDFTQVV